ncbi:MAG: hypothetical protein K6F35_10880 [Lachnospiraceae bacterium]|nr:hypothetical protein [Lachnospiraceae bacterium]
MMKKRMSFHKALAVILSASVLLQSPAQFHTVYAEPASEEAEPAGGSITDLAEPAVEEAEPAGGIVMNLAEPAAEESEPAGGYIEMPWDNDTPIAPADLDYKEALEMMVREPAEGEEAAGIVAEPESIEAKYPQGTEEEILAYLKGKYPPTRSQSPYGTCWAHSAIALSEFYLISHGLKDNTAEVDRDVDYSELALAYFCYNQAPDPVNGSTGDKVTFNRSAGEKHSFLDFGGNLNFAAQSLMRFNGVTNDEDDAAYANAENVLAYGLEESYGYSRDQAHLKNEYLLNIKENKKLVKQAIKENGIVGVSIYAADAYMNSAKHAFYNHENTTTNHAVAVVGWDDDYPASNFKTAPPENGAWLVRNSWTTNTKFAYHSYFWLSYCDKSLADTAYVFEMADPDNGEFYDNNYNYDSQLHYSLGESYDRYANVFTVVKNAETLKAVQLDAGDSNPGAYTVKIYKNLRSAMEPESGTLVNEAVTQGSLPYAGKYTITLNSPVELSEGETFSVVVSTQNPIDRERDMTWKDQIIMDVSIHPGESFGYSGGSWKDLSNSANAGTAGNLCIRALTDTNGGAALPETIKSLSVKNKTNQSITLVWSAARDAEGYEVWRSDAENGTYEKAGETSSSVRKYQNNGLTSSSTYYYKVYPVRNDSRDEAGASPVVSAKTLAATPEIEIVDVGNYSARVRWNEIEGCDGYEVEYGMVDGGGYYPFQVTLPEVTLYQMNPGTRHYIRVCAINTDEQGNIVSRSEYDEKEFTTGSGSGHAATGFRAEPYRTDTVRVIWDNHKDAEFTIQWSADNETWQERGPFIYDSDEIRSFVSGLDPNIQYYFRIKSIFQKYGQDKDEYTSATVRSYPKLPSSNVNSPTASDGAINITWTSAAGANYYSVYRRESNETEYAPLAVVPASGGCQYSDRTVLPGRLYYYRVYGTRTNELTNTQAETGGGYGTWAELDRVSDLTTSALTARSVTLNWSAIRGAESYSIEQYDYDLQKFNRIALIDSGYTSYAVEGLEPNEWYCFMVQAVVGDYKAGYSSTSYVQFRTPQKEPASPLEFTVTADNAVYDGSGHGAGVTSTEADITAGGFTVYYGKVVNGAVSSFNTSLPVNAGTYQVKIHTNEAAYHAASDVTDESWRFTIAPKTITPAIALAPESATYTGSQCRPKVTVRNGDIVLVKGTDYEAAYGENIHAGTGTVRITSKAGSNYRFDEKTAEFTISRGETSVAIAGGNKTVTYGAVALLLTATASDEGSGVKTWNWSSGNAEVASVDPSTGEVTVNGAGQAVITAAFSSNDTEGSGSITLTVNKAVLRATAKNNTITYGDAPSGNGVEFDGFVNGDTESVVKGSPLYAYSYTRYGNVGNSYRITPSGLTADNYDITYADGILTVEPKEVGLDWTGTALTYSGHAQKPSATATGLVNSEPCTVTVTGEETEANGSGEHYTAVAASLSNANYKLPSANTASFTIAKAAHADMSASASARYGNAGEADLSTYIVPGGSLKTTGIITSDPNGILRTPSPFVEGNKLQFAFVNDSGKKDSEASVSVAVDGGNNYADYCIEVTLTVIDKVPQNVAFAGIEAGRLSKTYGDGDFIQTAASNGGGAITYSSSDESIATVGAADGKVHIRKTGEVTIYAKAAATAESAEGQASYVLTIGKKEIGIAWSNTSLTYNKTAQLPTATATGLVNGDACLLTVTGSQPNAGTYTASVTALDNDDYQLPAAVTHEFTIHKKKVTIDGITASNKVYDGNTGAELDTGSAVFAGLLAGDALSAAASGAFIDADAGEGKTVSILSLTLGGASLSNYELSATEQQKETTADITRRPVTVKAKDQTVLLNGSIVNSASYAELSGAVKGHVLASVTLSADSAAHVTDSGKITPSAAVVKEGNKDVTGNYSFTYAEGVLKVMPGIPTVTPPSANDLTFNTLAQVLVAGGRSPEGTAMQYCLTENGTYAEALPEGREAGSYRVWYRVLGGDDYRDTEPAYVDVSIQKASLSDAVVHLGDALTYFGTEQTQTVDSVSLNGYPLDASEYLIMDNTALNAGSYTLTVTAAGKNYTGSVQKDFTVAKKKTDPVISVVGSYTYTGSPIIPEFTVTDGLNRLEATDYLVNISDNVNAGEGRITIYEGIGGNYSFGAKMQTFAIGKQAAANEELAQSALKGSTGTIDLKEKRKPGASFGAVTVSENEAGIFAAEPAINGDVLSYTIADSADIAGKEAKVTVPVKDADNYEDYNIILTITVIDCLHPKDKREKVGAVLPTCTEKGYTGDILCTECGKVMEYGEEIPIDPDNHAYDDGKETEPPTLFKEGVRLFTCVRCGHARKEPIPKLEGNGDLKDIIEDTKDLSGNEAPVLSITEDEKGNETETLIIAGEEVSKTVTEKESGRQTVETKAWIAGLKSTYRYTGSPIKPSFNVYDGTRKLKQNTDYTVSFKNNKNAGEAQIIVKFKGNYKSGQTETTGFTIEPAKLGEDIIARETGAALPRNAKKIMPELVWASTGKTVNGKYFHYSPDMIGEAGDHEVTVTPKDGNYTGSLRTVVRVVEDKNILMSNAKVSFDPKSYPYDGNRIIPAQGSYTVRIGSNTLVEGKDYRVADICNNINPGNAVMVFEALSGNTAGYVGSKTAGFKITGKKELKAEGKDFSFEYDQSVPFSKGGAKPKVTVKDRKADILLKEGTDYTLSYKNNASATDGTKAEIRIKGKGNYRGTVRLFFEITKQSLKEISGNIIAADQFVKKPKLKTPVVSITDLSGKKLKVNKDFTISGVDDSDPSNTETEGTVRFKVIGNGSYTGECGISIRYMPVSGNIAKAGLSGRIDDQIYTGGPVLLGGAQLSGMLFMGGASAALVPGRDFAIAGYQNNVKKGTAKVVIRGIGAYGGTKTLTFRIVQKSVDYKGSLIGGSWK